MTIQILDGSNPYKHNIPHPYELTSFEPSYGNENKISKLDPDDVTPFDPSYGLPTSVSNFNQTLNSKTSRSDTKLEF